MPSAVRAATAGSGLVSRRDSTASSTVPSIRASSAAVARACSKTPGEKTRGARRRDEDVINRSQNRNQVTTRPCYSWPELATMGHHGAQWHEPFAHQPSPAADWCDRILRNRARRQAADRSGCGWGGGLRPRAPADPLRCDERGSDRWARDHLEQDRPPGAPARAAGPATRCASRKSSLVAYSTSLGQLSPAAQIFYRVTFQDLADLKTSSAPAVGSLRTPGDGKRTITFAYSGDEAGQGWGSMLSSATARPISRSMSSSTTMPPTSIPKCWPGWAVIRVGPSTSPRPRPPGSTLSRISFPR